jgi:hypothetical protein
MTVFSSLYAAWNLLSSEFWVGFRDQKQATAKAKTKCGDLSTAWLTMKL